MAKHRSHSVEFKRQVAQEFLASETLHGLAKRHGVSRKLIRIWVQKYEQGAFDDDAQESENGREHLNSCSFGAKFNVVEEQCQRRKSWPFFDVESSPHVDDRHLSDRDWSDLARIRG